MGRLVGTLALILGLAALSGCAGTASPSGSPSPSASTPLPSPSSIALSTSAGYPPGYKVGQHLGQPDAVRLGNGTFAIILWGSSTCPATPTSLTSSASPARIDVTFVPSNQSGPCTADMAARFYVFAMPAGLAGVSPIVVGIHDDLASGGRVLNTTVTMG